MAPVLVNGRLLEGTELEEYTKSRGLCPKCARSKTHRPKRRFLGKLEPVTTKDNAGNFTVYKGYCLRPTCYTLEQAKIQLGEVKPRRESNMLTASATMNNGNLIATVLSSDMSAGVMPLRTAQPRYSRPGGTSLSSNHSASLSSSDGGSEANSSNHHQPSDYFQQPSSAAFSEGNQSAATFPQPRVSPRATFYQNHATSSPVLAPSPGASMNRGRNTYPSPGMARPSPTMGSRPSVSGPGLPTGPPIVQASEPGQPNDQDHPKPPYTGPKVKEVRELEEAYESFDMIRILNTLDNHGSHPDVATRGFDIFRSVVIQAKEKKKIVLNTDGWVKVVRRRMEDQIDIVVQEALSSLVTVLALHPRYAEACVANKCPERIIELLDTYSYNADRVELMFVVLEMIAREDAGWKEEVFEEVAIRCVKELYNDGRSREFAVRTLRVMAIHFDEYIEDLLREKMTSVQPFLAIINADDTTAVGVEASLNLLWRVTIPRQERFPLEITGTEAVVSTTLSAMTQHQDPKVHEAAFGVLANLALKSHNQRGGFPLMLVASSVKSIHTSFKMHPKEEQMIVSASNALCNIFSDSFRRREAMPEIGAAILVLLPAMRHFTDNLDFQAMGCLTLAYISSMGSREKKFIATKGGLDVIIEAYRKSDKPDNQSSDKSIFPLLREATTSAIASLTVSSTVSMRLHNSALVDEMKIAVQRETNQAVSQNLRVVIANVMGASARGNPAVHDNPENSARALLSAANAEEAESALVPIMNRARENARALEPFLMALNGKSLQRLAEVMIRFKPSLKLQEMGCNIMSCAYCLIPFTGTLNKFSTRQIGQASFAIHSHSDKEVMAIRSAMRYHRNVPELQVAACQALTNFMVPVCAQRSPGELAGLEEEVPKLFAPVFKDGLDAMATNESSVIVQSHAIYLFWTLMHVCTYDDRRRWSSMYIGKILHVMNMFPEDRSLHETACNTIMALIGDAQAQQLIGSSDGIGALFRSLRCGNENAIAVACGVIAKLLKEEVMFTASSHVMAVPDSLRTLIYVMDEYARSSREIQTNVCSIFRSLVTLEDDVVASTIASSGGMSSLCAALQNHGSDPQLTEYACRALEKVFTLAETDMIRSLRVRLGEAVMPLLEAHKDREQVFNAALDAAYAMCRRDDYFTGLAQRSGCVPIVVDSMSRYLASPEIQKSACSMLWALTCFGDTKETIGETGAIHAIVTGMAAHPSATAALKEAMTALKNLTTLNSNKRLFEQAGGERAVICCMLINMRDPRLLAVGFTALNNYAVDQVNRFVAPMQPETMQIVLRAMKTFSDDEALLKNACYLLKSYTYNDQSLGMMRERSSSLVPLLTAAAEMFPDSCRDRAYFIMEQI